LQLAERALALEGSGSGGLQSRLLSRRASLLTELGRFDEAREAIATAHTALSDNANGSPQRLAGDGAQAPAADDATARLGLALSAARVEDEAGDRQQAESGYRALIAEAAELPQPHPPGLEEVVLTARSNLSAVLRDRGALDESLALTREVLDVRRQ